MCDSKIGRGLFFLQHKESRILVIGSVAEGCYGYDFGILVAFSSYLLLHCLLPAI